MLLMAQQAQAQAQLSPASLSAKKAQPLQPLGLVGGGGGGAGPSGSPQPPYLLDPQGSIYGRRPDEKAGALKLYAEAAKSAQARGERLASEPAILALCEKQLTTFLRNFLLKQPNVKTVPHIAVVYR